jgi:hypothetical protein
MLTILVGGSSQYNRRTGRHLCLVSPPTSSHEAQESKIRPDNLPQEAMGEMGAGSYTLSPTRYK